jgi:hypothetical protein
MFEDDEDDEEVYVIPKNKINDVFRRMWTDVVNEFKLDKSRRMFTKKDVSEQFIQDEVTRFKKTFVDNSLEDCYYLTEEELTSFLTKSADILFENYLYGKSKRGLVNMSVDDKGVFVFFLKKAKPKRRKNEHR